MKSMFRTAFAVAALAGAAASLAQLRLATWNVSNYLSGRTDAIGTAVYGQFEGRSMRPDVILGQEFQGADSLVQFLGALNGAAGSPGDWAAANYMNNGDSSNVLFYRTSRVHLSGQTTIPGSPRSVSRFDVSLKGYVDGSNSPLMALYSSHMKAGTAPEDLAARLAEAASIRADTDALASNYSFVLGGDLNIQTSSQAAYQALITDGSSVRGKFFDPINTPGSWNNNGAFRFVHTQDPTGSGGMDDRHDQLLLDAGLVDGAGFDYIGDPNVAYSTTTWNDANHSYRAWGNDGSSFNTQLTTVGNTMVGELIAQALRDVTGNSNPNASGGHLPVFLDLLLPGEIGTSEELLDFGAVQQNHLAELDLDVFNSVDASIWGAAGVRQLNYTLNATAGFMAPGGSFLDAAGNGFNTHQVSAETSVLGLHTGSLTILDASGLSRTVILRIEVVPEPQAIAVLAAGLIFLAARMRPSA